MTQRKRGFGTIRRLPSKRWQAFYTGPDGAAHNGPATFDTSQDAEAWLTDERRLISGGGWSAPRSRSAKARTSRALTLGHYADRWMTERDLKPRTRAHYYSLLAQQILPRFGESPLRDITSEDVGTWHAGLDGSKPTLRSHAYGLLRTIFATAVADEQVPANPCHIKGAGTMKRAKRIQPATLSELEILVAALPHRYRLMTLLASWCALRFGELVELRRRDIDLTNGVIRVRRGAVRARGQVVIGTPKSQAGVRDVTIPPHLMPLVREHLATTVQGGRDGLLFPAADGVSTLAPSTLYPGVLQSTRDRRSSGPAVARPSPHRCGLAAQTGATLAELMSRLGHSTPQVALRYQHAARGRDAQIAAALSRIAEGAP